MVYALMIIFFHLHYGVRRIGMLQFLANLNELAYAMICWISTCVKPGKDMLKFVLPNCEHRSSIPPSQATSFPFGMIQNAGYTSIYEPFSCCLTVYLYILMFSPTPKMYN